MASASAIASANMGSIQMRSKRIERKRSPTLPAGSFGLAKAVCEIGDQGGGMFDRIWIEPMFADAIAEAVGIVQSQTGHVGSIT